MRGWIGTFSRSFDRAVPIVVGQGPTVGWTKAARVAG